MRSCPICESQLGFLFQVRACFRAERCKCCQSLLRISSGDALAFFWGAFSPVLVVSVVILSSGYFEFQSSLFIFVLVFVGVILNFALRITLGRLTKVDES